MDPILEQGLALIAVIQTASPALDTVMQLFTFLGTIEFYLLFLPLIYWNINPSIGFRTLLILLSTDAVSSSIKLLFRQPRPYWVSDNVKQLSRETTYGAPSSHASDSLAVWGFLAYTLRRTWVYVAVGLLILLISVSRLYLGMHFPHDLVIGWGIGLIVLLLFIWLEKPVARRLQGTSVRRLSSLGFIASALVILAGMLIRASVLDIPDPGNWASFSREARLLGHYFSLAGALFGAVTGYALMKDRARFDPQGPIGSLILRYLVGMAGVILVWRGLDAIIGAIALDETAFGLALRYLRYAATTLWAFLGAPWIFLRLNLAEEVTNSM